MKTRLRRTLACLALAAAATTTMLLVDDIVATPADTAWGAPDTNTVVDDATDLTDGTVDTRTPVTPLDTAWG